MNFSLLLFFAYCERHILYHVIWLYGNLCEIKIFINGCELSLFLYFSCEMHTPRYFCMITNVMSDYFSLFLMSSNACM